MTSCVCNLTNERKMSSGNVLSHPGLANLWQPDSHLLNGKKISRPETITHISSMGKVSNTCFIDRKGVEFMCRDI